MKKTLLRKKKIRALVLIAFIALCVGTYSLLGKDKNVADNVETIQQPVIQEETKVEATETKPETTPVVLENQKPTPPVVEQTPAWPVKLTSSEAASLTVVVNKKHKLPSDYVPNIKTVLGHSCDLRQQMHLGC